MAESIDSFVRKLRDDGIRAGQEAGEAELQRARDRAEAMIREAGQRAARIIDEARSRSAAENQRQEQELQLACRDTVLLLRQTLCRMVEAVLAESAAEAFSDRDFLTGLIEKTALEYVRADAADPRTVLHFRISDDDGLAAVQSALRRLRGRLGDPAPGLEASAGLGEMGFQLRRDGSLVEVTPEAVVDLLRGLVSTEIQRRLERVRKEPDTP